MILRRITVDRYGCFGTADFEFRRGLNLICGGNETGKSLLLMALPATILGLEHGMRLRRWGDSLSCRATLLFEGSDRAVRLTRELEDNLVRLEERGAEGQWRETFAGRVPPSGKSPEQLVYAEHLRRLFGVAGGPLLQALLDPHHGATILDGEGRLAEGLLMPAGHTPATQPMQPDNPDIAALQAEVATLEAELANDREEYRKGEDYLAWVSKRWEGHGAGSKSTPPAGGKPDRQASDLGQQHRELATPLQQGVPQQIPDDLPEMLATAEGLRQELATLQQESAPLQRSRQAAVMPASSLPLVVTLMALAATGAAYYLNPPWLVAVAGGCSALLLMIWGVFLVRLTRVNRLRARLDQKIEAVERKRSEALSRQQALAERFEAAGLPSTPVEMVKLQQRYRHNQTLVGLYHDTGSKPRGSAPMVSPETQLPDDDRHLRPEDLPEAEKRLAELGESVRRREVRLQLLQGSLQSPQKATARSPAEVSPTMKDLLPVICHLLERLTGGRYHEVRLEEERFQIEAAPGQWVPPSGCSRSTFETLSLAVRLALYQTHSAKLPLPLDDLPAALEPRRRQAAMRLIERLAVDHQVLLATCDDDLTRRALRERWQVVDLNMNQPGQAIDDKEAADAGQLHLL